jgi:hypothetical protein
VALGILDTVGLAAALALAVPAAGFGVSLLLDGDPLGAVFVVLAVALVAVEQVLVTPGDLPARAVEAVVGTVAEDPESVDAPEREN